MPGLGESTRLGRRSENQFGPYFAETNKITRVESLLGRAKGLAKKIFDRGST